MCRFAELEARRGVAALVHGQAVAIFRTEDDEVYAVGNHDPYRRSSMLARGIVGMRGGVPFVAPMAHGHAFDLRTGQCLEVDTVSVPAYEVKVEDGMVLVGRRRSAVA